MTTNSGDLYGAAANLIEGYAHNGSRINEANERLAGATGAVAGLKEKIQEAMGLLATAQGEFDASQSIMAEATDNAEGLRGGVYEITVGTNNDDALEAQGSADACVNECYEGRAALAQLGLAELESILASLVIRTDEEVTAMTSAGAQMLEAFRVGDLTTEYLAQWQGII